MANSGVDGLMSADDASSFAQELSTLESMKNAMRQVFRLCASDSIAQLDIFAGPVVDLHTIMRSTGLLGHEEISLLGRASPDCDAVVAIHKVARSLACCSAKSLVSLCGGKGKLTKTMKLMCDASRKEDHTILWGKYNPDGAGSSDELRASELQIDQALRYIDAVDSSTPSEPISTQSPFDGQSGGYAVACVLPKVAALASVRKPLLKLEVKHLDAKETLRICCTLRAERRLLT